MYSEELAKILISTCGRGVTVGLLLYRFCATIAIWLRDARLTVLAKPIDAPYRNVSMKWGQDWVVGIAQKYRGIQSQN